MASSKLEVLKGKYFNDNKSKEGKKAEFLNRIRHEMIDDKGRIEFYQLKKELGGDKKFPSGQNNYLSKMEYNLNSVVMVIHVSKIQVDPTTNDNVIICSDPLKERSVSYHYKLCDDIAYGDQQSAYSTGSGFFIKEDIIATAAHVVVKPGLAIEDFRFVHGINMESEQTFSSGISIHKSKVFKPIDCKYYLSELGSDFAVIKVKCAYDPDDFAPIEKLKNTHPIRTVHFPGDIKSYNELFQSGNIRKKSIYSIGHGLGLPLKVSYLGTIKRAPKTYPYFEARISLVGGNSGSPVFDADTHELIGIFTRGNKKLELKKECNCLDVKAEDDIPEEGQECQRLEMVFKALELL